MDKYYTPEIEEFKICKQCNIKKNILEYRKVNNGTGFEGTCKKCAAERTKLYRKNNKEKVKVKQKECYNNKKDYYINKTAKWRKDNPNCRKVEYKNIKNNPLQYFKKLIRSRISQSFSVKNWKKNTKSEIYLGCNYKEAFDHIEKQFKDGMNWENKCLWHIDHIIPLSYAKDEITVAKLCNYKNLQPLWIKDNLQKSDKIFLNDLEFNNLIKILNIN